MTVIARRIKATPGRSAVDAWTLIIDLVAPSPSPARQELFSISGVASTLIASETPKTSPIVFHGCGPRVRFYCLYDEDSVCDDQANEETLQHCPCEGSWAVSLPCLAEDLDWVKDALAGKSRRVTARDQDTDVPTDISSQNSKKIPTATIDEEAFFRS